MSAAEKWLDELRASLMDSIYAESRTGVRKRKRRLVPVVASLALASVLLGATTALGLWESDSPSPASDAGIVAEPGERVTSPAEPSSSNLVAASPSTCFLPSRDETMVDGRPDAELIRLLRVFRDEERSGASRGLPIPVFSHYVRGVSNGDFGFTVVAASGSPDDAARVPQKPECERFHELQARGEHSDVACVYHSADLNGGMVCGTASQIRRGDTYIVEDNVPGLKAGNARIFGLVPDGVESVKLVIRRSKSSLAVVVPARRNTFVYEYQGSATVIPEVSMLD